jgi:hypothetical protein
MLWVINFYSTCLFRTRMIWCTILTEGGGLIFNQTPPVRCVIMPLKRDLTQRYHFTIKIHHFLCKNEWKIGKMGENHHSLYNWFEKLNIESISYQNETHAIWCSFSRSIRIYNQKNGRHLSWPLLNWITTNWLDLFSDLASENSFLKSKSGFENHLFIYRSIEKQILYLLRHYSER